MLSVNTNTGAMVALQYLNNTQAQLAQTQSAINSGEKVSSAKDNGAVYAIAQNQRGIVPDKFCRQRREVQQDREEKYGAKSDLRTYCATGRRLAHFLGRTHGAVGFTR